MKRTAIACLFVLTLLLVSAAPATQAAIVKGDHGPNEMAYVGNAGHGGQPLAGGGDDSEGDPSASLDSGDDDDYWEGINDSDEPERSKSLPVMLQLILESWWTANSWLH